jgi:MFS family permease
MDNPARVEGRDPRQAAAPAMAGWYAVTILCVALLLSYTDRFVINLIVDPIRVDLGLSDVQVSLLQGVGFAIIFAVAALPSGRLADRVNRRNLIAGGVLLWSVATIACGLATDFWSFFAARVAVGLGEAALVPAASSLIIDLFSPRRRGTALGIVSLSAACCSAGSTPAGSTRCP